MPKFYRKLVHILYFHNFRGYAANCRVKRDDQKAELQKSIKKLEATILLLEAELVEIQKDKEEIRGALIEEIERKKIVADALRNYGHLMRPGEVLQWD